jgi:hypothetical protein
MAKLWFIVVILVLALLLGLGIYLKSTSNIDNEQSNNTSQMANPASVYCIENNGTLEIRTNEQGQYGVCLKNGKECEEWAYIRGECIL